MGILGIAMKDLSLKNGVGWTETIAALVLFNSAGANWPLAF